MAGNKVRIQLFGKFRSYLPQGYFELILAPDKQIGELRMQIINYLKNNVSGFADDVLVNESAIADQFEILGDLEKIGNKNQFSILPPVCGG